MLCNRFWHVQICTSSKQNKIMYNHVDCRDFHAFWGFFWWCTKKNEFPKKIFFKGSNNWYHCGWYFAAIEYIDPVYSLRNTLHIRRVNPNIIESPKKKLIWIPASPSLYLTKYLYTYNELIFSRFGPSNPSPKSKISCIK